MALQSIVTSGSPDNLKQAGTKINNNKLFLDGKIEDERAVTYTDGFDSLSANLNIGWLDLDSGYHLNGTLDELAVYNT